MTGLQEKVLDLLKEIDALCRKNDITWYLAAGSALGAIRHHGFIPWDDDADICMTVENWEKFYAVKDQIPAGRMLICPEDSYDCGYMIARYADLTSTRLYRYLCSSPQPAGLIVDILVLDRVPDDAKSIEDYIVSLTEYADVLTTAATHAHRCPYPLNDAANYDRVEAEGRDAVLDDLRGRIEAYRTCKEGVLIQRDATVPHVWKEEVYGRAKYVPFEDTMLPVAAKTFAHLCGAFNEEWMYVPEQVERQEHIKGVLLDISNNNPFDDYLSLVDSDHIKDLAKRITYRANCHGMLYQEQDWERLKMAAVKVKLFYRRKGFPKDRLLSMLENGRFEEAADYFAEYHALQANKALIGGVSVNDWLRSQRPFYVDLGDDFLFVYLRWLMQQPALSKANRILRAREEIGRPLSQTLQGLRDLIEGIHRLCQWMEEGHYRNVLEEAGALRESYPENLALLHLYFGAGRYLAEDEAGCQSLLDEIRSLPDWMQADPVLACICADRARDQGDREAAFDAYREIIAQSTHGLLLYHIFETLEKDPSEAAQEICQMARTRLGTVQEEDAEEDYEETAFGDASDREDDHDDDDHDEENDENEDQKQGAEE